MENKSINGNNLTGFEGIPERHLTLFRGRALGLSLAEAAAPAKYSREYACRLTKTEAGKLAISKLRAEMAELMTAELPSLVTQSIEVLRGQLNSPWPDRRTQAAQFILRHVAGPMLESGALNTNDAATGLGVRDNEPALKSDASENERPVIELN